LKEAVLCYHAVSPTWDHRMSIHPELLLRQVRLLRRLRRVRASFDDAFRSAATVFPELEVLGVPIQIFACTGYARNGAPLEIPEFGGDHLGQLATMTWDDLRAHAERGVTISSHGVSHAHLTQLSDNEVRRELTESKQELEDRLGRACSDFAYPYGEHDDRVRSAARAAGYAGAFALGAGSDVHDPFAIPRVGIWRGDGRLRAALKTSALARMLLA
jgi:peptidoglycan/xylan/chitin deacetylase (PgdA/CDA1 family)